ncbi:MAG: BrnT family toxin [Rhizomicrobium sp.]
MDADDILNVMTGFDWDAGNRTKNEVSHQVSWSEVEEIFFNQPLVVADDAVHSGGEPRHYALGRTEGNRRLFVVFTIRGGTLIRVISARDMSKKERAAYEQYL